MRREDTIFLVSGFRIQDSGFKIQDSSFKFQVEMREPLYGESAVHQRIGMYLWLWRDTRHLGFSST